MKLESLDKKNNLLKFNNIAFLLSIGLCFWLFFLVLGSCILFTINITISTFSVWILNSLFFLCYSFFLCKQQQLSLKNLSLFWILFILLITICGLFVSYFYDFSYDGQAYHGVAVYHFINGWNPFKNYLPYEGNNIYINHYTQGSWITYSCFYAMFKNFEFAKIINLLFMFSTWGIVYKLLYELSIKKWLAIWITTLVAFHPVGLNMYLGMYIDGQMASCITMLIVTLIFLYQYPKNRFFQILLIGTLLYLINIKFTGLVYSIYFVGCWGLFTLLKKQFSLQLKNISISIIAIIIATFFLAYPSYVKNTLDFKNPFYPLNTKQSTKDVLSIEPSTFKNQNRVLNFIEATFAKTGYSNYYDKPIEYKIPFMIEKKELEKYAFSGVMIGGFGVWFSGILLLSFILYCMALIWDKDKKRKFYIIFSSVVIGCSCFLLEAPWWARYAPQLYLIPFISILYYHLVFPINLKIIYTMIFLLIVNTLLIVLPYTYYNIIVTRIQRNQFTTLKLSNKKYAVDFKNHQAQKFHFEKYQIPYEEKSSTLFSSIPDTLFRSEVVYESIILKK